MISTFPSEVPIESQVFSCSCIYGDFDFRIADTRTPIWKGDHCSGGKLAFYRAVIEGHTKAPVRVYIYVLWFQNSEGTVVESFTGYKIYSAYMNEEKMFEDLMSVITAQLSQSGQEFKDQTEKEYERVPLQ